MKYQCRAAALCLAFFCAVLLALLPAGTGTAAESGFGGVRLENGSFPAWQHQTPHDPQRHSGRTVRTSKAGAWHAPQQGAALPGPRSQYAADSQDAADHFFRQAKQRGYLDRSDAGYYGPALHGLPWLSDSLPWLLEHPSGMRRTLDALKKRNRTFIGPFVYYSSVHNYEKILIRHVDLRPVIRKIAAGSLRPDTADGWKIFNNYERRLPQKRRGYYYEVRVPTAGLRGPGPQRLVYGAEGEIYYTADHYETFHRLEASYK